MADETVNIIKGCQKGNSKAQRELYERFSSRMFGICLRYSGNHEDAQDILQEGFLKVFEKINQFKFKGAFEGWLRRIMINTALEKFRNQYQVININDNIREVEQNDVDDISSNLSTQELLKFIQELSPKYRLVFNMYAIEGYSHKEIGEMLNITEGTSKSNLSRARSILQEKVKKYYMESVKVNP